MRPFIAIIVVLLLSALAGKSFAEAPRALGMRRELFVDSFLIDRMVGAALKLHAPRDAGTVMRFDQPWEGPWSMYGTVIKDGDRYRLYYRGMPTAKHYEGVESTCYAESTDGVTWTRPTLRLFDIHGAKENNVILTERDSKVWTLAPFLDTKPGVDHAQRFKAIACESILDDKGKRAWALIALTSSDGVRWSRLRDKPVVYNDMSKFAFDSQNVAFWSEAEQTYVLYGRSNVTEPHTVRQISRWTSEDFVEWSPRVLMRQLHDGRPTEDEQLYTNQTQPYFRAPHLYIAVPARLVLRQALSAEQVTAIGADPQQATSISDTAFATSRGGDAYDRTFMESWIRPGVGPRNWLTRDNYAAYGIVQTGEDEMSVYVHEDYGLPTAHLERYAMRLDGFASVNAPFKGGEMITRPLTFAGERLVLNYSTSAVGEIRVEAQDEGGAAVAGFTLADCEPIVGDEIERMVRWKGGSLAGLADKPLRLRFVMKDADLFALQFVK
jgi:hypothetical protein